MAEEEESFQNVRVETSYICAKCQQVLDETTLTQHPCFTAENDGEEPEFEFIDQTFEGTGEEEEFRTEEEEEDEEEEEGEDVLEDITPAVVEKAPKFTMKVTSSGRRGDWSDQDVHRLLDVYIANYKRMPMQKKVHNHLLWDRVMRDLQQYGNFSRFLVQAKIKKLKKAGRTIMEYGGESRWPYLTQVLEVLRLEDEMGASLANDVNTEPETEANETASDEGGNGDENGEEVTGLRRWTLEETRHLIDVYKLHLPKFFTGLEPRKIAWDDIIADLGYDLSSRYTMYQIRAKIRNAQNTFRHIVENKRKKNVTHWPLFADMADLAKVERELAQFYSVPIGVYRWGGLDDPDAIVAARSWKRADDNGDDAETANTANSATTSFVLWNEDETQALLIAYSTHQATLLKAAASERHRIWEEITDEVNKIHRGTVTVRQVTKKMEALRQMWYKNENGLVVEELAPFYEKMKEIMDAHESGPSTSFEAEKRLHNGTDDDDGEMFNSTRKRRRRDERTNHLPPWYVEYQKGAQRRHDEKLEVQEKLLTLLEALVAKCQGKN